MFEERHLEILAGELESQLAAARREFQSHVSDRDSPQLTAS
jgi:hypothetical protein